jgi:hypothetical protein
MDESLANALLDMEARDRAVRSELTTAGSLGDAYHPRLEEVHRANGHRLRQIIAAFGWPGIALVGPKGAKAAWRIALHSHGEPDFMRQCRDAIRGASVAGDVPRWQFAIIDDRIHVYEGRAQKYGTQLRAGPHGLEPHPIENHEQVNSMRDASGLPPLAQTLAAARAQPQPTAAARAVFEAAELDFRRQVGWIS